MRVLELWRYPVKSMGGERVDVTAIGDRGLHGDRLWALRDEERGVLTNAKRFPALLACAARFVREPAPDVAPGQIPGVTITLPDGATVGSDDPDVHARLSALLGHRVTLCALRPASDRAHYKSVKSTADDMRAEFAIDASEPLPDFSMMPMAKLLELGKFATPPGTYFDAMALHVVTTASLAVLRTKGTSDFDVRRFRPNVFIETTEGGLVEAGWTGGALVLGGCTAFVDCPTPRCSMPTRAQADLGADPKVLKTIVREAERCLGAYATVTHPGEVRVGDAVRFEPPETSRIGDWARARATGLKRMLIRAAMPK
ncbi:MAG: sulfurase [Deltaproteobacteria bacterium]|nr:sulfurase [Deltaproteobacteria bacterium]